MKWGSGVKYGDDVFYNQLVEIYTEELAPTSTVFSTELAPAATVYTAESAPTPIVYTGE